MAGDGQETSDEHFGYLVTPESYRAQVTPDGVEISTVDEDGIDDLHETKGFDNALGYAPEPRCPHMAATVARHEGRVIGMAGVSADSEEMWQIGIDVVDGYRIRGVGKALVGRLTELVFAKEKLPYYATGMANIASQRLALAIGYRPTWTEVYAWERRR